MRTVLRFTIPVETGNATINDGTLPKTMDSILNDLKPEADENQNQAATK